MRRISLASTILLFLAVGVLAAQQGAPIEKYLNADGSLRIERGYDGPLDIRGWRMTTAADGSPRFMRSSPADTLYQTVEGDENWDDRFGPPGTSGIVNAVAVRGDEVYVGGRFVTVGNIIAYNIACWNNRTESWSTLGSRSNDGVGGVVNTIAIAGDDIYVGGSFESAGTVSAFGIARWNRSTRGWSALGDGVRFDAVPPFRIYRGGNVYALVCKGDSLIVGGEFGNEQYGLAQASADYNLMLWNIRLKRWFPIGRPEGVVHALAVRGNDLYVGGSFRSIAGIAARSIARCDMTAGRWHPLGSGIDDIVHAIAIDSAGVLYAGGDFDSAGSGAASNIARWDGSQWRPMGDGADAPVDAITIGDRGELYAGGTFTRAGGRICNGVARWNAGGWSPVGTGVGVSRNATSRYPGDGASRPRVAALGSGGGELYGGGIFSSAGTITAHNIARWNTKRWRPLIRSLAEPAINGIDGEVYAVALSGEYLYAGGDFTRAGDIAARGIARWNGTTGTWSALGAGIGGPSPFVRAIAVRGDTIAVGGIFTTAGGIPARGIALWNGSRWSTLDGGMRGETPYVFALAWYNDQLHAAGAFSRAGTNAAPEGIDALRIARWDGDLWHPLGEGIAGDGAEYSYVTSLAVGADGLYAAGEFSRAGGRTARRIARWDGTAWSPLGDGLDGLVSALAVDDTMLYAGGEFTHAGGEEASYIARWNGSRWSAVGGGVNAPVHALAVLAGGRLAAGGEFTFAGESASHVAIWNGAIWRRVGRDTANGTNGVVHAIAGSGDRIFAGGLFSIASGMGAQNIAEWDGRRWSALGSDPAGGLYGRVAAIGIHDGAVYVGGAFDAVGGLGVSGIARWDGVKWTRLGAGVDNTVRAIIFDRDGDLYAGGEFHNAGTLRVNGIARWDGSEWHALAEGVGGNVYAMAIDGNDLYVGGRFDTIAGLSGAQGNIARWDMITKSWHPMGGGVSGSSNYVAALASRGGILYAGGRFNTAGGIAASAIARWDGNSWGALDEGVRRGADTPAVYALAFGTAGELYVGGAFSTAGGVQALNIAEWRSSQWKALGDMGMFGNGGDVYALVTGRGGLYAGGRFVITDVKQSNALARWDGAAWDNLGSGVVNDFSLAQVNALALDTSGELYAGGTFTVAGGKPSYYFAIWHSPASVDVEDVVDRAAADPSRAWPNPFAGVTTIEIDLPGESEIRLTIHAPDGRVLATPALGRYSSGRHRFEWDAAGYPSGIYYYSLRAGARVQAGRLVVMK